MASQEREALLDPLIDNNPIALQVLGHLLGARGHDEDGDGRRDVPSRSSR